MVAFVCFVKNKSKNSTYLSDGKHNYHTRPKLTFKPHF